MDAFEKVKLATFKNFKPLDGALKDAVADTWLLEHNPFYASVRQKVLSLGYTFSSKDQHAYISLPIGQIQKILTTKTIPYLANYEGYKSLIDDSKTELHFSEIPEMRANYTLHEGAHAIAYEIAKDLQLDYFKNPNLKNLRAMLLQESFANATEQFANAFVKTSEDVVANHFNSWIHPTTKERQKTTQAVDTLGERLTFSAILLGFVFANFMYKKWSEKDIKWCLQFLEVKSPTDVSKKQIIFLLQLGQYLSENFRTDTLEFQLKFLGAKVTSKDLLKVSVPALFEDKTSEVKTLFNHLVNSYFKK
jgi:hypothetical protein